MRPVLLKSLNTSNCLDYRHSSVCCLSSRGRPPPSSRHLMLNTTLCSKSFRQVIFDITITGSNGVGTSFNNGRGKSVSDLATPSDFLELDRKFRTSALLPQLGRFRSEDFGT